MEGRDIWKLKLYLGFSPGKLPTVRWIIYCCDVLLYETRWVKNVFGISEKDDESLREEPLWQSQFSCPRGLLLASLDELFLWLCLWLGAGQRSFLCCPGLGWRWALQRDGAHRWAPAVPPGVTGCPRPMAAVPRVPPARGAGLWAAQAQNQHKLLHPPHTVAGKQADQTLKNQSFHM